MWDCCCPVLGGGLLTAILQRGQHKVPPKVWVPWCHRFWLCIGDPQASNAVLTAQFLLAAAQAVGYNSKRFVRAQSLHWWNNNDYKWKQTLCGVWSMGMLQLGDSHPSCSAKPRASLIMQRSAELKTFSHLWVTFGTKQSCMDESFRPAQKKALWAWQREDVWN